MNTWKLLHLGKLLVSTMVQRYPNERWRVDARQFALTVNDLPENGFAKNFWVTQGGTGITCPAYSEMMSSLHFAGLVSYLSPEFTHMVANISPRGAKLLVDATPTEIAAAEEFVTALWEAEHGVPADREASRDPGD